MVAVGPHASTTPRATLRKLGRGRRGDRRVRRDAAATGRRLGPVIPSATAGRRNPRERRPHSADMTQLPALHWDPRNDRAAPAPSPPFRCAAAGPGRGDGDVARLPVSLHLLREGQFPQPLPPPARSNVIGEELDGLIANGRRVRLLHRRDLPAVPRRAGDHRATRRIKFGMQTRIDLWSEEMLDLLGEAGCVSIEAGVESITEEGRALLDKKCKISTDEISDRLIHAKQRVPFVQANLLDSQRRRSGRRRGVARASARARRLGEQARAAVSLSRLARLHAPLGRARRSGLGARARILSGQLRRVQRHSGAASGAAGSTGIAGTLMPERTSRADDRRHGGRRLDVHAGAGARRSARTASRWCSPRWAASRPTTSAPRPAASRICELLASDLQARMDGRPWRDVAERGDWLLDLEEQYAPDVVHLNSFGHGALPWQRAGGADGAFLRALLVEAVKG